MRARVALAFASLLASVSALAAADAPKKPLDGCRYPAATAFVSKYCAGCHTEGGTHAQKKRAHAILQLDTYEGWKADAKVITAVLDKWHLDGKIMPPAKASAQPGDAERKAMLEWLARGSPNTPNGK